MSDPAPFPFRRSLPSSNPITLSHLNNKLKVDLSAVTPFLLLLRIFSSSIGHLWPLYISYMLCVTRQLWPANQPTSQPPRRSLKSKRLLFQSLILLGILPRKKLRKLCHSSVWFVNESFPFRVQPTLPLLPYRSVWTTPTIVNKQGWLN